MVRFSKEQLSKIDALFSKSGKIALITHQHPDGDALGSTSALNLFIKTNYNAKVTTIVPDEYPLNLSFIAQNTEPIIATQQSDEAANALIDADLIVFLDINSAKRTDSLEAILNSLSTPKILIDHHLDPDLSYFEAAFSKTDISSTCELLYYILKQLSTKALSREVAEALLAGMTTDTNNFANSVYPSTLAMASELLELGADRNALISKLYHSCREERLRLLGHFLQTMLHITADGIAYAVLDQQTASKYNLQDGETEGFVNMPLNIEKVRASIFIKQKGNILRVSIRSKPGFSAVELSRQFFHGGGHELAAGGQLFIPDDVATVQDTLLYIENATARFVQNTQNNE